MACKQLGLPTKGKFSDGSLCYQKINKKGKAICAQNGKYGKNKKDLPVCDIRWLYGKYIFPQVYTYATT